MADKNIMILYNGYQNHDDVKSTFRGAVGEKEIAEDFDWYLINRAKQYSVVGNGYAIQEGDDLHFEIFETHHARGRGFLEKLSKTDLVYFYKTDNPLVEELENDYGYVMIHDSVREEGKILVTIPTDVLLKNTEEV